MDHTETIVALYKQYIVDGDHSNSDYFGLIKKLVQHKNDSPYIDERDFWQKEIQKVYSNIRDEIIHNNEKPINKVKFGTSGWRGIIGKDLFAKSVSYVTLAIINLYSDLSEDPELRQALGVQDIEEAKQRGAVVGFDNRFGGEIFAKSVCDVLTTHGFAVHYAGESTTGALSAAVLELNGAFSINLTPSHNPLEYGGFKINASDAGPAAPIITNRITENATKLIEADEPLQVSPNNTIINKINALDLWKNLVRKNVGKHGIDYEQIIDDFSEKDDFVVAIDCVHGASKVHIRSLFKDIETKRLLIFRSDDDPTFGGVAPEPSSENMAMVTNVLETRDEKLKLGVIIDPDADRIRFTDSETEISMNEFGAMAYHFLHEVKNKKGMVAKTVATSNFANALAKSFNEEIFEPKVGFKEFKPVINKALVFFEESDGISIIGHTPEKDAYIGLLLALDMVLTLNKNLGQYLEDIKEQHGRYYPDRDSITVSKQGSELLSTLAKLEKYAVGSKVLIGEEEKTIAQVIDIDGRKMILEDGGWLMIRPSGTEPKVRFYVEARDDQGRGALIAAANKMLAEIGLL